MEGPSIGVSGLATEDTQCSMDGSPAQVERERTEIGERTNQTDAYSDSNSRDRGVVDLRSTACFRL